MCRCALLDPHSNSCDGDLGDPPPRRLASPPPRRRAAEIPPGWDRVPPFPGKDPYPASLGSCRWIAPRPALLCPVVFVCLFPRREDSDYPGNFVPELSFCRLFKRYTFLQLVFLGLV